MNEEERPFAPPDGQVEDRKKGSALADQGSVDDIDTGEPISLLAQFDQEPERGFLRRLRQRIDRQALTSQLVELGWRGPVLVFLEWLGALFQLGSVKDEEPDRSGTEKERGQD